MLAKLGAAISAQVISPSVIKGSYRSSGDVFIASNLDDFRIATVADFDDFRVVVPRTFDAFGVGPKIAIQ